MSDTHQSHIITVVAQTRAVCNKRLIKYICEGWNYLCCNNSHGKFSICKCNTTALLPPVHSCHAHHSAPHFLFSYTNALPFVFLLAFFEVFEVATIT